jgi:hypothetical protein
MRMSRNSDEVQVPWPPGREVVVSMSCGTSRPSGESGPHFQVWPLAAVTVIERR